jgi:hypothetical protein
MMLILLVNFLTNAFLPNNVKSGHFVKLLHNGLQFDREVTEDNKMTDQDSQF